LFQVCHKKGIKFDIAGVKRDGRQNSYGLICKIYFAALHILLFLPRISYTKYFRQIPHYINIDISYLIVYKIYSFETSLPGIFQGDSF